MLCVPALLSVFWRVPVCVGSRCLGLPGEGESQEGGGFPAPLVSRLLGRLVHKTGFSWLPKSDPWGFGEGGEAGGEVQQIAESYRQGALGHFENVIKVTNPLLERHSRPIGWTVQGRGHGTPDAHFEPCPGQEPCFRVSLNPSRPWGSRAESTAPGPWP